MAFRVSLIAGTSPDWVTLTQKCTEMFGKSPTRELDQQGIPVGNPGSFAFVLENINNNSKAIGNMQLAHRSLDFVHLVFAAHFSDMDEADSFRQLLNVQHFGLGQKIIFAGTLREIRDLILKGNTDEQNVRVCNVLYELLCGIGFKTLFGMKKGNLDGSFKLLT